MLELRWGIKAFISRQGKFSSLSLVLQSRQVQRGVVGSMWSMALFLSPEHFSVWDIKCYVIIK